MHKREKSKLPIDIPPHGEIFKELDKFYPLMKSVVATDLTSVETLQTAYINAMLTPYRRELSEFFADIKNKMKKNKESRLNTVYVIGYRDGAQQQTPLPITKQPDVSKSSRPSPVVKSGNTDEDDEDDDGDDTLSSISNAPVLPGSDMRVDLAFAKCISDIADIVYHEQTQFAKFFHFFNRVNIPETQAKQVCENAQQIATNQIISYQELNKMLEKLFKLCLTKFQSLIAWIEANTDRFFTLNMIAVTEQKLQQFQAKSDFLGFLIADVLCAVKNMWKKFMDKQLQSIEEYKCVIKKTAIIPCIAKFPFFVDRFTRIMTTTAERSQAETNYFIVRDEGVLIISNTFYDTCTANQGHVCFC